jgi:hypothetical protein
MDVRKAALNHRRRLGKLVVGDNLHRKAPKSTFSVVDIVSTSIVRSYRDAQSGVERKVSTNSAYAKAAFFQSEGPDALWEQWPSNWWGIYEATFGAQEVNLHAYPTFIGNQRILLTTARHFRRLPIKSKEMTTP